MHLDASTTGADKVGAGSHIVPFLLLLGSGSRILESTLVVVQAERCLRSKYCTIIFEVDKLSADTLNPASVYLHSVDAERVA